jgi:hypothetical protein
VYGNCNDDIYYPDTDLVMHLRGELLNTGKRINIDTRTIDLNGCNRKNPQNLEIMYYLDILPPGVSHWEPAS